MPEPITRRVVDLVVVAACATFVFVQLHPELILADTTPAGGDMGAHVYGFAFLRDHLLPSFRLSGWSPDWYAGFPMFHFYMVVPFLGMVALNAGVSGPMALVPAVAALLSAARAAGASWRNSSVWTAVAASAAVAAVVGWWTNWGAGVRFAMIVAGAGAGVAAALVGRGSRRRRFAIAAIIVAVGGVALPYGPAFKVVTVIGVVALPVAAYVFGRGAGFPFPTPALLSVASLGFLFDKNFTIYGGNAASTMAGEFAFSISLSLAVAYLGVLAHGLRTGRRRVTAGVLLALVALCHVIPAIFAVAATVVIVVAHVLAEARDGEDGRIGDEVRLVASVVSVTAVVVLVSAALAVAVGVVSIGPAVVVAVTAVAALGMLWWSRSPDEPDDGVEPPLLLPRLRWTVAVGALAATLSAWWILPFVLRRTYLNDMGWEKIAVHRPGRGLWDWFTDEIWSVLVTSDLQVPAALALVGAILALTFRSRMGTVLVVLALAAAIGFVYAPQGRLWNARLLPFWYLLVYLLAAVGVGEIVRALATVVTSDPDRPSRRVAVLAAPLVFLVVSAGLGAQLRNLPGGRTNEDGSYRVLASVGIPGVASFDVPDALAVDVRGRNFVTDWSRWNYSGYEGKAAYPEYRSIVAEMADIGRSRGCGRSLWEYAPELNDYGTPMALMLLPHWTDGCIGSMEGLYFEASSTTPFHFLVQSELSDAPSRAQRDLPYRDLDIDAGVGHLELLGVRYYLARSPAAIEAARGHDGLTEIAASGPWVVFEVPGTTLVEPLAFEPVVTTGGEGQHEWLCSGEDEFGRCTGTALDWFQDPTQWDVAIAATGPGEWQRVSPGGTPERRPLPEVVVRDVEVGDGSLSFDVDTVGVPVVVKESYFPNWKVSGARGPFRVAPNLMVVVPTARHVELTYGRTPVDILPALISLGGIVLAVALARRVPGRVRRLGV